MTFRVSLLVMVTACTLIFEATLAFGAAPTVTISASPTKVFTGQPFVLTWTSTGATGCIAAGNWSGSEPTSGSMTVTPSVAESLSYSLTCTGSGSSASATAKVTVSTPTLSMSEKFSPNAVTISTSEGAPYGDCDFWTEGPSTCFITTNFGYGPTKVIRVYICLSGEVSNSECSQQPAVTGPLSASMLSKINSRIGAFAHTGVRLMIRFTYNMGPIGPGAMDAPIDLISSHIDQLAPIVLKHKDLIFALEAGFIGTWGEWHDSTNGNDTAAAHKTVLDRELGYFSGLFPILVRYPADLIQYTWNTVPPPGLGIHDDYYDSSSDDAGTWDTCDPTGGWCLSGYTASDLQKYAANISTTTMFAGEFGALDESMQSCSALNTYSYTYHSQSISLNPYPADIGTFLQSEGCATSFFSQVGTRIVLQEVTLLGEASPSGRIYLTATMVNGGYGRVIRERSVYLVVLQEGKALANLAIPVADLDLRTLAASATPTPVTFAYEFTLPHSVASGQVSLALLIKDPAPTLSSQAAYALPLNSNDESDNPIFDASTGYNTIATFDVK